MSPSSFEPQAIEHKWYQAWEESNAFAPQGQGEPYCIMIPPPNVTGTLHMGHGFQHTLMDALIRYHRMQGRKTLWQTGTDHAGIATQMVVERQLKKTNTSRHQLGREAFIDKVWQWKKTSGNHISQQMRRLGASVDWSTECFTMDEARSKAVKKAFIRLYNDGLIYRGQRLVNWDPKLGTAISDLEVISENEQGHLWRIRYPIENSGEHLLVATTRPETLFGDVAVAVNPKDERFKHLIGRNALIPLCNRPIPIIADEHADPEFGTGCVKITPAHDFNDHAVGKRHNLPCINILTPTAHLNDHGSVPNNYQGLYFLDARKKVVSDLKELQLLESVEPHTAPVPRGDRSGEVIQPYLTYQWFVKAKPLALRAIEAVKKGQLNFIPDNWSKTYFQWLENIEDWCISRQLWWGHRIPAWHDADGKIYVGESKEAVKKAHKLSDDILLSQDEDVLDTWFSSALWPMSTLGWPEQSTHLKDFYPTQVLMTGFDIIFFWVARMVMFGIKFTDQIPFKEVYITGLIRDAQGQKMSKSKGNTLDPIDLIDGISLEDLIQKRTSGLMQTHLHDQIIKQTTAQFPQGITGAGTDALRFTFCALASTGRDIRFDTQRLKGYHHFCNKLWHASRFVMQQCPTLPVSVKPEDCSVFDRWIQSKLEALIKDSHQHYKDYRFDRLAQSLHQFVWDEFCAWYLECAKTVLNSTDTSSQQKSATQHTLLTTLDTLLRLLHPMIPFITEEIWSSLKLSMNHQEQFLMLASYPQVQNQHADAAAESSMDWLKDILAALRNMRSQHQLQPNQKIALKVFVKNTESHQNFKEFNQAICALAKLSQLTLLTDPLDNPRNTLSHQLGDIKLYIPLENLVDKDVEIDRIEKKIKKLAQTREKIEYKLFRTKFSEKAPKESVESEKTSLNRLTQDMTALTEQLKEFKDL